MTSIKVAIKVRPLIEREKEENRQSLWTVFDEKTIKTQNKEHVLSFDKIFDETRSTQELFDSIAKPIISSAIEGINGTIFAYGQTSSGKTYCMKGTEENPGIVPLAAAEIFKQIENIQGHEFLIRIGYIEIYNEKVYDLLDPNKCEIIKSRKNLQNEVVLDQTEIVVMRPADILEKYVQGNNNRRVEETNMNDQSSRSHTLFRIVIESKKEGSCGVVKVSTIYLVDLAGSERASQTKASGERLREGGHINKSLLFLSKIIRELGDVGENNKKKKEHINYRDSKLTQILSTSLGANGGNAQTAIICTITPANIEETLSTFTFASNAKKVKTLPKVNEILSDEVLMQRMQKEIAKLKSKLAKETAKNSEEAIQARIREQIFEREVAFIHSGLPILEKENRRRTWVCPGALVNEAIASKSSNQLKPLKTQFLAPPPPFVIPRDVDNNDENVAFFDENAYDEFAEEIFKSPNEVNLDRTLSPDGGRTTDELTNFIRTPRSLIPKKYSTDSLNSSLNIGLKQDPYERIAELEANLQELEDFKFVEMNTTITDKEIKKMQAKIANANTELSKCENIIDDLRAEMKAKDETVNDYKNQLQHAQNESKKALKDRSEAESRLAGLHFELDLVKSKAKNRESELLSFVEDAREESKASALVEKIKSLEEALKTNEEELFKYQAGVAKVTNTDSDAAKRIKELENELQLFREDRQSMKHAMSEQTAKMKELEEEQLKLSDQAMEAIEENEKLQREINELTEKLSSHANGFETLKEENQRLAAQVVDAVDKAVRFEKIQEVLQSGNGNLCEEDFDEDDDIGKLIVKLHHDAAKKDTLESEKLQLMKDFDEIRQTVVDLSEKLVASQAAIEVDQQMRTQVQMLSEELVATKNLLVVQCDKSSNHDAIVDDLRQQLEKVNRENLHMSATLKECESLEADNEMLTKQKQQRDAKIDELILKIEQLNEKLPCDDKSTATDDLLEPIKHPLAVPKLDEEKLALESEVRKLTIINQKFEADLGASNITVSELMEKLSLNQTVIEGMNEKLATKDQLMNDFNSLSAELIEIKSKVEASKTDITMNELTEKIINLSEANASLNDLQSDLEARKTEVLEKDEAIEKLQKEILEHQQDYEKLMEKISQYEAQITEKDEQIVKLDVDIFAWKELQSNEQQDTKKLHDEIKIIRNENNELETANEELQQLIKDAKTTEESLKSQLEEIEQQKWDITSQNEMLSQQVQTLAHSNASFSSIVKEFEEREMNCFEKFESEKLEKDAKIKELASKINDLEQKLSNNNQSLTDEEKTKFEHEKLKLKEQNEKVEMQNQQLEDRIKQLEDQFSTSKTVCDELQCQLNTNKASIEALNGNLRKSMEEEKKLGSVIDEYKKNAAEAKTELHEHKKKIDHQMKKAHQLQTAYENSTEKLDEMKAVLTKLTAKLQETETERNTKHNSLSEVKGKLAKLQAQHSNCESYLREIHEREINEMKAALSLKEAECAEAKTRLRRRSKDNIQKMQELEAKNNMLVQRLGEIEALKMNADMEIKRLKEELKKASDENDVKFTVLHEKYSQLSEMNQKLEAQKSNQNEIQLKCEIDKLNAELTRQMSNNFVHAKTVSELRQKCEDLAQQLNPGKSIIKKTSTSPTDPKQRRSNEHEDETFALQHKKLLTESNSGTPVRAQRSNNERKNRRQSVYDDHRRRLSVWETSLSVETQTENVHDECACCELREQVNQLKTQLKVYECKVSNFERLSKIAKADLKQAQTEMEREKREHAKAKENHESEIGSLQYKIKTVKAEAEKAKQRPHRVTRASQTVSSPQVDKSIIDEVQKEKSMLERKVNELEKQLKQFEEEKKISEKENINQNVNFAVPFPVINVNNGQNANTQGASTNRSPLDETLRKYDMAKRLCTMRNETIEKLTEEKADLQVYLEQMKKSYQSEMQEAYKNNAQLKAKYDSVKYKYDHAKGICNTRYNMILDLRKKYGELDPADADPVNSPTDPNDLLTDPIDLPIDPFDELETASNISETSSL